MVLQKEKISINFVTWENLQNEQVILLYITV